MSALKKFKEKLKLENNNKLLLSNFTVGGKNGTRNGSKKNNRTVRNYQSLVLDNPFEKKFQKTKFNIVNKKIKSSKAAPRPGRKRALEFGKKRDSLKLELENRKRENVILDKRFGEYDQSMSTEDKMLIRFMKEKASTHSSSRGVDYNLNNDDDDEEYQLTHMGQSLAIDDFASAGLKRVSDDEQEQGSGMIDADVVKFAHFGGFEADEKEQANPMHKKSRNEIMKEIIQKSKMHKRERQLQKEEDLNLVEQVDADLDEIRGLLAPMSDALPTTEGKMVVSSDRLRMIHGFDAVPSNNDHQANLKNDASNDHDQSSTKKVDDYDKLFRELARDGRAAPTDRTKTDEEIAVEKAQELMKAEEKRRKRMQGLDSSSDSSSDSDHDHSKYRKLKKVKKESGVERDAVADDLGDDHYRVGIDVIRSREEIMPLTYNKDGVLINNEIFMKPKETDEDSESGDNDDSDEDESGDDDDSDEDESGDDEDSESGDNDGSDEDDNSESESGKEIDKTSIGAEEPEFEMLHSDRDDSAKDSETSDGGENHQEESDQELDSDQAALEDMYEGEDSSEEETVADEKPKKKKISKAEMENASRELPYTFDAPKNFADFKELIRGRSADDEITIIKRLLILYNIKLDGRNRVHMENLSSILMERVIELGNCKTGIDIDLITKYRKHSIELCRLYPNAFAKWCTKEIQSLRDTFNKKSTHATGALPGPGHLIMFSDFRDIYSCSDLNHHIINPTMLLLGQFLSQAPINGPKEGLVGIYICQIFYSYTIESKRFIPEVASFLHFILAQCLKDCEGFVYPKIVSTIRKCAIGALQIIDFKADYDSFSLPYITSSATSDSSMKMLLLHETISFLIKFCKLWNDCGSIIEVFGGTMELIQLIPSEANPKLLTQVSESVRIISPLIESAKLKRRPLQLQKRKAIPIKTYVPKFHSSYSVDKRYDPDQARAQEGKLKAEYKKEFKGAVRELRKDAAFLAREKLNKIKEGDAIYKKKMDQIVGQLAEQEGAMRGYEKAAKKKSNKRF